jgi:hypothetical protein
MYFLAYLSILFPNSYIILFWEFYFLPFSVHAQTTVIYLILGLCYSGFLTITKISLWVNVLQFYFSLCTGPEILLYTYVSKIFTLV